MKLLRQLTNLQHEHGHLSDDRLRELAAQWNIPLYHLEGLVSFYPHFRRTQPPHVVDYICRDVCCEMACPDDRRQQLEAELTAKWGEDFAIVPVSCLGRCDAQQSAYETWAADDTRHYGIHGLTTRPPLNARCDPYANEEHRYATVRGLAGQPDALAELCIERLSDAGLRGMGGAWFLTGMKWKLVAEAQLNPPPQDRRLVFDEMASEPQKYVICNADESEPGTFKDREILAQLPHLIIEGMLLAGLTIGAERGIVFIRHEYEPERALLETALDHARACGILGGDAAGSGRRFDIEIFVSPGGYILGEETALLECLEDRRGEPRNKPPYPSTHGLYGQPTLINNVETFALATAIVHHGVEWWAAQGEGEHRGLKFVSISGDVERPGVYEIPLGTSFVELIDIAGGMKDGQSLKAFLPGGASSRFLTAAAVDTPIDFDDIRQAGSMLGTGAVIVFDEGRNLFEAAANLTRFFRNESCGKCVPCRLGSEQAVQLITAVSQGDEPVESLDTLRALDETLLQTSICGLGQVALTPMCSMLTQFPNECPTN